MSVTNEVETTSDKSQKYVLGESDPVAIPLTVSEQLAAFAYGLNIDDLPQQVIDKAKLYILDAIGIAFASSRYDFAKQSVAAALEMDRGDYRVIAHSLTLSMRDSAFLNGLLIHGLDYDDTHLPGVVHATASIFPTALACSQYTKSSGADLLVSYVAGMEITARLGMVAKGGFHQVGFHPTGLMGAFGSAVTAGKLIGLSKQGLAAAQGIAGSMASGSLEFLETGAWTKRIHPGWAAVSGITAATLAKQDFVAPSSIYEGRFGLYASHLHPSIDRDISLATSGLGLDWEILRVAVKPFPACHFTHSFADAAIFLANNENFGVEDIEEVVCLVPEGIVKTVCEPSERKRNPGSDYDAKFSLPYVVATSLLRKKFTLAELEDEALQDPLVVKLASKVSYQIETKSEFPRVYPGEVAVRLRDGRILSKREAVNRGADERPLSKADIIAKFIDNVKLVASDEVAESVVAEVLGLDSSNSVKGLADVIKI